MIDSDLSSLHSLTQSHHMNRRMGRPRSLLPDPDAPNLAVRWFHAVDSPISDPIVNRRARSGTNSSRSKGTSSPAPPASPKRTPPKDWIPFSKRDSNALEKAYQNNDVRATVLVNEDHLFEVDVTQRTISPVYWEGPVYEVRRATWFMQGDGSKWVPCEENLAEQIELGYYKHKPWLITEDPPMTPSSTTTTINNSSSSTTTDSTLKEEEDLQRSDTAIEEKKLEQKLEQQPVEKQWNLLGPYLGQYMVYTGTNTAWLLYNTAGSKIAKSIITRLTNRSNLGGTRLLRGYPEVEKQSKSKATTHSPKQPGAAAQQERGMKPDEKLANDMTMAEQEMEDYDNEDSEEEVRSIDHLVFVIHGIGQKMSERMGQNFTHDVNMLRKTLKSAYSTAIAATDNPQRPNGIQVLPILWRHEITFGMASDDEEGVEMDLGMIGADDGCPTLDEVTLDGVPNIRLVVSDVLLDVPLYLTQKYRDQMTSIITREINRVYRLFVRRNPDFIERNGKVTLLGHSLGSLLAFDILSTQPEQPLTREARTLSMLDDLQASSMAMDKKSPALLFPVRNFFAVGSPLGVILLLRGYKIASRKCLEEDMANGKVNNFGDMSKSSSTVSFCYPAVENLYNIFHKSDPVAYRLEPLIARQHSAKLKPVPITYIKGGLKSVIDAGFSVGSGIANRAGAMYESFKMGLTANLFMRGLGLSKQLEDDINQATAASAAAATAAATAANPENNNNELTTGSSESLSPESDEQNTLRSRSRSDPSLTDKYRKRAASSASETSGAEKLRMLNQTGRVDFCLQEGILENPYLSAFSAHMQYWQDLDVAAFLVREIYRN